MNASTVSARPITGRRVLLYLLLAFGVVSAVNAILIVMSLNSFTGETQPKSYANGLDFNHTLKEVAAQRERGWKVNGELESPTTGVAVISIAFRDAQSLPLEGLDIVAYFRRPTNEGYDFEAPLKAQGEGRYKARVEMPLSGKWNLRLAAARGDATPFLLDYKLVVK